MPKGENSAIAWEKNQTMKGIQSLVDEHGNAKLVLIDLGEWGGLWKDIYDGMIIEARRGELTFPWEVLKAEWRQN